MREYTRQEQEAAAVAAKLIAAEGRTWARAFRDAQRSVGIRPDPNLTASEIRRWFALFAPHEHQALLAAKRHAALHVMRSVPELNCRLIGVVLSGAAVETSPAELVAIGTGEKEAFLALLNAGFLPEPLDAPYPTAFARRVGEKCLDSLLLDVRGEPVLVRIVPEHTPHPARRISSRVGSGRGTPFGCTRPSSLRHPLNRSHNQHHPSAVLGYPVEGIPRASAALYTLQFICNGLQSVVLRQYLGNTLVLKQIFFDKK